MSDVLYHSQASHFAVDAFKLGIGGCLLQEDNHGKLRPVAYSSKSLTSAETRYANIYI